MRLLDTATFELVSDNDSVFKQEGYAILSHRWIGSEIKFEQLGAHIDALRAAGTTPLESPQQEKIRGACHTARAKGIRWMWIDTCCIDKSSTSELSESLNSMFRWYQDAKLCITYLSDVTRKGDGREDFTNEVGRPSIWFSRGWTLQELLAPRHLEFFDKNWGFIGDRAELAGQIEKITSIQSKYLKGETKDNDPRAACIATKFSWISDRQTERVEDMAYSMLGLFGIKMTPQYDEGWEAFMRLQKELLSRSTDESLFAWKMPQPEAGVELLPGIPMQQQETWKENEWGLLAARPMWFKDCAQMTVVCPGIKEHYIDRHGGGVQIQQRGLQISLGGGLGNRYEAGKARTAGFMVGAFILFATTFNVGNFLAVFYIHHRRHNDFQHTLNCWDRAKSGDIVRVRIWLQAVKGRGAYKRVRCTEVVQDRYRSRPKRTTISGIVLQPWILES